jgi:preprotein translocase subunit SecB
MSESENKDQDSKPANTTAEQQFALQKIYVKDLSFETPNSPGIFTTEWKPEVNVQLDTHGSRLAEDVHEVVLRITVTAKLPEDKVAYLIEVQQAGIFTLKGFGNNELAAMLGSYCPTVLFPYAREVISDLVIKGGFPQMLLAPVNFDAIYRDHIKRLQEQQASGTGQSKEAIH